MLRLMREHATSWLIKVALFAIVIVFIFWGVGSLERREPHVAVVNGSYIGIREYQSEYDNMVEQMRSRLGKQFSSDLVKTLNLKGQVLNRLISRRLMLAEARRLKLEVTKEELQNAIRAYPAFQSNGQFDPLRYQQILRSNRLTPQEFEASQREVLLIKKVESFITRGTKVLDAEMRSFFHQSRDKVNLDYVQIRPKEFADQVEVDEEAIRAYFDEHRENYRLATKRNIVYVRLVPRNYLSQVDPTAAEVEEFYRLHQDDYKQPKKVRARHILFRISEKAKTSEIQKVLAKAKKVLALASKGDDFAGLARKYSEDSTAAKGGDVGYFKREDMVKPFSDSAFSLKKGEISDLVRSRFGLHIIKVEDIKEESIQPLTEAKQAVLQSLKKEGAAEIARQRAEAFIDASRALDDLLKAAADQGLEAKESGFFAASEPIPQLGRYLEINEVIFSLQLQEFSPVLNVGEDQLVAQLVGIEDSRLEEFTEVQKRAREDWSAEQSRVIARKKAAEWLATARKEGGLAKVARRHKLKIEKTGLFTAISPARPLGNQRDLVITAFALTPEQPVAPEVYEVNDTFIIFQLQAHESAPEEEFQKEKNNLAKQLLQVKKEQTFSRWVTARRQQSDIRILQEL